MRYLIRYVYLTNIVQLDVDSLFCMVVNRGVQVEKHFYPWRLYGVHSRFPRSSGCNKTHRT